jgi:hypothetical protein
LTPWEDAEDSLRSLTFGKGETIMENENWIEIEAFAVVDANGDYGIGKGSDEAREDYERCIGDLNDCETFRVFKVKLRVEKPRIVELIGEAPLVGNGAKLVSVQ